MIKEKNQGKGVKALNTKSSKPRIPDAKAVTEKSAQIVNKSATVKYELKPVGLHHSKQSESSQAHLTVEHQENELFHSGSSMTEEEEEEESETSSGMLSFPSFINVYLCE